MSNPFKRKRSRFPNGIPQAATPEHLLDFVDEHGAARRALLGYESSEYPRYREWFAPDPSDWLDDIDPFHDEDMRSAWAEAVAAERDAELHPEREVIRRERLIRWVKDRDPV